MRAGPNEHDSGKNTKMDNLEDQLNQLLAQSDRVSAELKREIYLVERADAAIRYLRDAREKTAHEVSALLAQRANDVPDDMPQVSVLPEISGQDRATTQAPAEPQPFGPYNPKWPKIRRSRS